MRKILVLLLTTVLGALVAPVTFAGSAAACACGAVMVGPGDSSHVSQENVLLTRNGSRETITMSLALSTDAPDAGLVVPTPTPATVSLADPDTFDTLDLLTRPEQRIRHHLIGGQSDFFNGDSGASGAADRAPGGSATVLSSVDLGPIRATTLRADDPNALRSWLTRNGYGIRPEVQRLFDTYTAEKWTFVAMKLTPKGRTLAGALPPVSMTFTSAELVHPLQLSRAARTTQRVRTYVLADHRTERTDPTARTATVTALYAGRPGIARIPSAQRPMYQRAPYLTASEQVFTDPQHQIRSDLSFGRAPDDTPYTRIVWHDEYYFTWDEFVLLVLLAALLGTTGWGVVHWIRRARRTQ